MFEISGEKETSVLFFFFFLLDSLTHIQSHLHTVPGVVRQGLRQTRHAVVTISQDLDAHALVFLHEKVKKREKKTKTEVSGLLSRSANMFSTVISPHSATSMKPKNHTPTQLTHLLSSPMWDELRLFAGTSLCNGGSVRRRGRAAGRKSRDRVTQLFTPAAEDPGDSARSSLTGPHRQTRSC